MRIAENIGNAIKTFQEKLADEIKSLNIDQNANARLSYINDINTKSSPWFHGLLSVRQEVIVGLVFSCLLLLGVITIILKKIAKQSSNLQIDVNSHTNIDNSVYKSLQQQLSTRVISPIVRKVSKFFEVEAIPEQGEDIDEENENSFEDFISMLLGKGIELHRWKKDASSRCLMKMDKKMNISLSIPSKFFRFSTTKRWKVRDMDSAFVCDKDTGRFMIQFKSKVYNFTSKNADFIVLCTYTLKSKIESGEIDVIMKTISMNSKSSKNSPLSIGKDGKDISSNEQDEQVLTDNESVSVSIPKTEEGN